MLIRPEQEADHAAIARLTQEAFAGARHASGTEAQIVSRLRSAGDLTLSLVAEDGTVVVGHVAFSPVTINFVDRGWFGLGPISVTPARQRQGIGSSLIRDGLERLCALGAAGCVLLGDPGYYGRFGFERDARLWYDGAPPEYFMRLSLTGGDVPIGRVEYAPAFSG